MDNFFITSCQHATVQEIHALGIPFEFTWYRLVGRLAHLDFDKGLGSLLSCTLQARYQLHDSYGAQKGSDQPLEDHEKSDALLKFLSPMKYQDGDEPLILSFALIKDVIDPTLDIEYEWIGLAKDIENKRIFQAHSQRKLQNFDPLVYLKFIFSMKYWVTGESRLEDYLNQNSKLPQQKPDFNGMIEEPEEDETSKKEKREFGVNQNLISEMMKVKESFVEDPEQQVEELDEEDLPQDFWSQKSD